MGNTLTPDELREVVQELTEEQLGIVWGGATTVRATSTYEERLQPIQGHRDDGEYKRGNYV